MPGLDFSCNGYRVTANVFTYTIKDLEGKTCSYCSKAFQKHKTSIGTEYFKVCLLKSHEIFEGDSIYLCLVCFNAKIAPGYTSQRKELVFGILHGKENFIKDKTYTFICDGIKYIAPLRQVRTKENKSTKCKLRGEAFQFGFAKLYKNQIYNTLPFYILCYSCLKENVIDATSLQKKTFIMSLEMQNCT